MEQRMRRAGFLTNGGAWRRTLIQLFALLAVATAGCGRSLVAPSAAAPSAADAQDHYSSESGSAASLREEAPGGSDAYAQQAGYEHGFGKGLSQAAAQVAEPGAKAGGYDLEGKRSAKAPAVVYTGQLKLQVRRLMDALDAITTLTEKRGGYVESMTRTTIVVRVPGTDFEAMVDEFGKLGELLERQVKAVDVSQQFTDLGARLAVAREARSRLLALLERTKDLKERLQIVQEIKRLSEQIEGIDSTLATLKNLVEFFTVTIDLVPLVSETARVTEPSPFPWISALSAATTTLTEGLGDFQLALPPDFVLFDEDKQYRAQAADTAIIRVARIDNEPRGDTTFWSDAVQREMQGRGEKLVENKTAGPVAYRLYRNDDLKPRYYLVGVAVAVDDLFVTEVFFPNEESYKRHHVAIAQALNTFRAK
jgi:Domain of unknown function (DUF4349)